MRRGDREGRVPTSPLGPIPRQPPLPSRLPTDEAPQEMLSNAEVSNESLNELMNEWDVRIRRPWSGPLSSSSVQWRYGPGL